MDGVFLCLGLGGAVLVILASHLSCAVVRSWFRDVDIRRYCQMSWKNVDVMLSSSSTVGGTDGSESNHNEGKVHTSVFDTRVGLEMYPSCEVVSI